MAAILDFDMYFGPSGVLYALYQLNKGFSGFFMSEKIPKDALYMSMCQLFTKIGQYTYISSRLAAILDF